MENKVTFCEDNDVLVSLRLLKDLGEAVQWHDKESVRKNLLEDYALLGNYCSVNTIKLLLLGALKSENEEIFELTTRFIKFCKLDNELFDESLLLLAIINQYNVKIFESLLKNDIIFQRKNITPESVFSEVFLSKKNRIEKLKLLLKYGLGHNFLSKDDENLLQLFLRKYALNRSDDVEIAEMLLDAGSLVEVVDKEGFSPLFYAIASKNLSLISILINRGANVNEKYNNNSFPMYAAVVVDPINIEVLKLLIENGADINARTRYGFTVLHEVCNNDSNEQIISFLVQRGANVFSKCNRGTTPLSLLDPEKENYERCLTPIVKKYAKMIFEYLQSVNKIDMKLTYLNSTSQECHDKCLIELNQMSKRKFYEPYSYYSVLKMSNNIKKLARLTKNEEFLKHLKANINEFSYYKNDLQRILDEALEVKDQLVVIESRLKHAIGNYLPSVVLRKLSDHLSEEDLPLQQFNMFR